MFDKYNINMDKTNNTSHCTSKDMLPVKTNKVQEKKH